MAWQVMVVIVVVVLVAGSLGAWWMWLVHDSQPIEIEATEEG